MKEEMKWIGWIMAVIIIIYFAGRWGYRCGEYSGQEIQYSFHQFKSGPVIRGNLIFQNWRLNITGEQLITPEENHKGYRQLHQHSGGFFNPFCR